MGYNTRPEMVEQNAELLTAIKTSADSGKPLPLRVKEGANISTEQYRLRRLLSACDAHRSAMGGQFAGLGQRVSLRIDPSTSTIEVRPIGSVGVERFKPSEKDAIDFLIEQQGSMALVEFWPSPIFTFEKFYGDALAIGWNVVEATREESPNGKLAFAAERAEPDSTFPVAGFGAIQL